MQKDGSQVETTRVRNILVLTTSYPNDSDDWSGVFIHKLNMALSRKGYRIFVLSPSNGGFYGLKRFDDITVKRFPYFWPRRLESLCSGAGGIPENMNKSVLARFQVVTMTLLFGLHAFVQSRHADLIYANWLGSGIVGAIAGFIRGVPLVTSFRGDDGYLARKESVWRVFSKFVIARSSALALVSRELAEICLELGASKDRVFVPRFGVDTNLFCPDTHKNSDPQKVKIVYVGSLIPKKGVQDLIEALSAKVFDNVVLEVVGEGFYSDDLKKMAETANISHRVIWRGLATPNEVARIMK
jgi:glycosyltransferase involved in cell wall biosynthesis